MGAKRAVLAAVLVGQLACRGQSGGASSESVEASPRVAALTALAHAGWVATASPSTGAANAIDGNVSTAWTTTSNQVSGQWFEVDLGSPQTFVEVALDTAALATNYPRAYELDVSNDNAAWTTVTTGSVPAVTPLTSIPFAAQTARYVRVTLTSAGGNAWSIYELNVYTTANARTGWIASASATGGTDVASKALDGDLTTRWDSGANQAAGQSFTVDMLSPQTFNQIALDAGASTGNYPRGFQINVSNDGTTWGSPVATGTGATQLVVVSFAFQQARYVKITQTGSAAANHWSIHELNVYGQPTAPGTLSQAGWVATGSPAGGANPGPNAVDGLLTTWWSTGANMAVGNYFQVDLGAPQTFAQLTLNAADPNDYPRGYQVSVSNDGTSWGSPVATGTGAANPVTVGFPAQTARYVRITLTSAPVTTWWSIRELNIYATTQLRTGWIPKASSTSGTDVAMNALDNDTSTKWTSNEAQTNGQSFQVDMVAQQVFNQITLDAGRDTGNYPRGYQINVSNDGTTWGSPVATGTGASQVVTIKFLTQTARYLKITQTGTATNKWSIRELEVSRGSQPCDTLICAASDQCHVAGTCDPSVGACSNPTKANGTTCDDADTCSSGDVCTAGVCLGVSFDENCTGPSGYLHPQYFLPKAGYLHSDAYSINSAGTMVGYSSAAYGAVRPAGQVAESFIAARGGNPTQLANPWPNGGEAYALSINDQGFVGGTGGPDNFVYNTTYHNPVLYHPDQTFELPNVPQVYTSYDVSNTYGPTTGLPDLIGRAQAYDAGALGAWHLDGDAQDLIGHTSLPSPPTASFVTGRYGQAVSFDGQTCIHATETADTNIGGAAGLTMMAWVKPDPAICSGTAKIVFQRGSDYSLALSCNAAGHAAVTHYLTVNESGFSTPVGDLPFGQWSHVAVSWDHRQLRTYVNGAVAAIQPLVGTYTYQAGTQLAIGCAPPASTQNFTGAIDEVALFRHPMGADQVSVYMNNRGDYRPAPSGGAHWQWSRYIDGFFDLIPVPAGAQYAGTARALGRGPQGILFGSVPLLDGSTAGMISAADGKMQNANDLLLGGSNWNIQEVGAINAAGIAVGDGFHGGVRSLFKLDLASKQIVDLGAYPRVPYNNPTNYLHAFSINSAGHIVGTVYDNANNVEVRPVVYAGTSLVDLNDYIDPASGWVLQSAFAINDSDEIVGSAHHGNDPGRRAYRLKLAAPQQVACIGKAEGVTCDDNDACTQNTTCHAGSCVGSQVATNDSNPCTTDTCNPATGVSHAPVVDGTACPNATVCDGAETCQAGVCTGGTPPVVDDGNPCTHDACDAVSGVSHTVVVNGSTCDDGNACTQNDTCQAGACKSGPLAAVNDNNGCTYDACDPVTGVSHVAVPDWTACDDGNPCTIRDACFSGACVGVTPKTCRASDQCHGAGTCDPTTGACSNPLNADGTSCNDGNACTQASTCSAGVCTGSSPVTCPAADACHVASCDSTSHAAYPTNDLVGLWHLDGDLTDASGNGNTWEPDSNVTKVVPGKQGSAYDFDSGTCLNLHATWATEVSGGSGLTFAAWVKPTGVCPGTYTLFRRDWQVSVRLSCTAAGQPGLSAGVNTGSGPFVTFPYTPPMGSVPQGQWSMVAVTWDKQVMRLYVNGVQVGSVNQPGTLINGSPYMGLGCYDTHFLGTIDEAAWYRRALSAAELAALVVDPNPCKATPKCADPDACNSATCDLVTGACSSVPKADGASCDDHNGCTQNDVCSAGQCRSGAQVSCAAPAGLCDEATCDQGWLSFTPSEVISQWHLDGDVTDASGNGHDLTGGSSAQAVAGRVGHAMHFDGNAGSCATRMSQPDEAFTNPAGVTLAAWIEPDANLCATSGSNIGTHTIIDRRGEIGMALKCYGDNVIGVSPQFNWLSLTPVGAVPAGQWSHVVLTYDPVSGAIAVYVNGVYAGGPALGANTPVGPSGSRSAELDFGCGAAAAIDEAIILRRSITATEIARMFQSPTQCSAHPKVCEAMDGCHLAGTCDSTTGVCSNASNPGGQCSLGATPGAPTILEPIPGMGCSEATGINDAGTVVGYFDACSSPQWPDTQQAFPFVIQDGTLTNLPLPNGLASVFPVAVSATGYVAVNTYDVTSGRYAPYLFRPDSLTQGEPLPFPVAGGKVRATWTRGDSDLPTVVGEAANGAGSNPWQWAAYSVADAGAAGQVTAYPASSPGLGDEGTVLGANLLGDMVGYYTRGDGSRAAVVWTAEDGFRDLSGLVDPVLEWDLEMATAINSDRQIVGVGTYNANRAAFRLDLNDPSSTTRITALGSLDPYDSQLVHVPTAINSLGHIVGTSGTLADQSEDHLVGQRAFAYMDLYPIFDMNDLVPMPAGTTLASAVGLNDNDEAAGVTLDAATGVRRAYKVKLPFPAGQAEVPLGSNQTVAVAVFAECTTTPDANNWTYSVFGYTNATNANIHVVEGPSNQIRISNLPIAGLRQPSWFLPGTQHGAAVVYHAANQPVSWTVGQSLAVGSTTPCDSEQTPEGLIAHVGPHDAQNPQLDQNVVLAPDPKFKLLGAVGTTQATFTSADALADSNSSLAPIGPRAAGAVPGTFTVTSDGAAQYEIPIVTPPGRAGVEPHLSLVYQSRGGEGVMGPGWSISGLSRISRCLRTRADAQLLSQTTGAPVDSQTIQFDGSDEFCLDGEHLVVVQEGPSDCPACKEYRTRRDVFAKIVVTSADDKGPTEFAVYRKDGMRQKYGSTLDSRIDTTRTVSRATDGVEQTQSVRAAWYLAAVSDRYNNGMSISYINKYPETWAPFSTFLIETEAVPDEIHYTTNAGRTATKSVKFTYIDKQNPNADQGSIAGWTRHRAKLLKTIDVRGPSPVDEGLIRQYRMFYSPWTISQKELLYRFTVCDGAGVCQAPTTFNWSAGGTSFVKSDTRITDAVNRGSVGYTLGDSDFEAATRGLRAVDLNGDGRDDLIYRRNVPFNTDFWGDPAHDPKILMRFNTSILTPQGVGVVTFGAPLDPQLPAITHSEWTDDKNNDNASLLPKVNVFDLNSDGIADIVLGSRGAGEITAPFAFDIYMGLGAPGEFERIPAELTGADYTDPTKNPEFWNKPGGKMIAFAADLTGDGRPELIRATQSSQGYRIGFRRNSATGLGAYEYATLSNPNQWQLHPYWKSVIPIDADGDGRAELLNAGTTDADPVSDGRFSLLHIGANGTTSNVTPMSAVLRTQGPYGPAPVKLLDFNGDGLQDILLWSDWDGVGAVANFQLWMNTGASFTLVNSFTDTSLFDGVTTDFDGDGRDDVLYVPCNGGSASVQLSNGDGTFTKKMLTDVPAGSPVTPIYGYPFCFNTVLDANGDGLPDIIQYEGGSVGLQLYTNVSGIAGQLKSISNGLGSRTDIQYATLTATADKCVFPEACGSKVRVVSSYQVDDGTGGGSQNNFNLAYEHPVFDSLGRGWQGFEKRTETNEKTGAIHTTTFDMSRVGTYYWNAGTPVLDYTSTPLSSGKTVRHVKEFDDSFVIVGDPAAGTPFAVRPHTVVEGYFEGNFAATSPIDWNQALWKKTTSFDYDSFGNVISEDLQTTNVNRASVSHDTTVFTYSSDTENWLLSQLQSITQDSVGPNGETQHKVSTFVADPTTGFIGQINRATNGTPDEQLTTVKVKDSEGNLTNVTSTAADGTVRSESITYDAIDGTFPAAHTNALGHVTQFTYHNGLGVLVQKTDPNGANVKYTYDGLGRPLTLVSSGEPDSSWSYERASVFQQPGYAVAWTHGGAGSGRTTYDTLGREISVSVTAFDGQTRTTRKTYSPTTGQLASVTQPSESGLSGTTTMLYDEAGRLIETDVPGTDPTYVTYGGSGEPLTERTYQGPSLAAATLKKEKGVDENGRPVTTREFSDTGTPESDFVYGPFGTLRDVVNQGDGSQFQTDIQYDRLGRRTRLSDPDAGLRQTAYNAFGDVRQSIDSLGKTTFQTDGLGRVEAVTRSNTSILAPPNAPVGAGGIAARLDAAISDERESFTWDASPGIGGLGQLASSSNTSAISSSYLYDDVGRLTERATVVGGVPYKIDYAYDPAMKRLAQVFYPDVIAGQRMALTYHYGPNDGLVSQVDLTGSVSPVWTKNAESDAGHLASVSLGDGSTELHDYDLVTGWLSHIAAGYGPLQLASSGYQEPEDAAQSLVYLYDPTGRVQVKNDGQLNNSETYSYDNIDRLTGWTSGSRSVTYGYGDLGNLKTRDDQTPGGNTTHENYVYGLNGARPHAVTAGPRGSYSYDVNGRQTSRPGQIGIQYNRFDLPTKVPHDGTATTFQYDADGTRVLKTTGTASTTYIGGLYERRVTSGAVSHVFYIPGPEGVIGQLVCAGHGSDCGPAVYFHHDKAGSIDTTTGGDSCVQHISRDPYGLVVGTTSSCDGGTRIGFVDQEQDDELGLINLNHRLYDPSLTRFITPDPKVWAPGSPQGYNRYAYGLNSPTLHSDPSGLGDGSWSDLIWDDDFYADLSNERRPLAGGAWTPDGTSFGTFADSPPNEPDEDPSDEATGYGDWIGAALSKGVLAAVAVAAPEVLLAAEATAPEAAAAAGLFVDIAGESAVVPEAAAVATSEAVSVGIPTPYATELQSGSQEAVAALADAKSGASIFRTGQLGESMAGESQYWALTNPLAPGYADGIGLPNVTPDFVMGGQLAPNASVLANEAAGLGVNSGGQIQIVTSPGGVHKLWFHMP